MDGGNPHIDVRAIRIDDAPAIHELDYSFETDRIYTLCVRGALAQVQGAPATCAPGSAAVTWRGR